MEVAFIGSDLEKYLSQWFSSDELENVKRRLAIPPVNVFLRINSLRLQQNETRRLLDTFLFEKHPQLPPVKYFSELDVVEISGIGPRDINERFHEVIVDLSCGYAVLRGADIFVPGVLAMDPRIQGNEMVSVYIDLDGCCRQGLMKEYTGAKMFIGNGKALFSRFDIFQTHTASGVAVRMTDPIYMLPCFNEICQTGDFFIQNLPSVIAVHVLDPQPGEYILDMCASPGGKSTHIASLMQDKGVVVALDRSRPKVTSIMELAEKMGITCIRAFNVDSTKIADQSKGTENLVDLPFSSPNTNVITSFAENSFDRILLDPPCSNLGQRPRFKIEASVSQLEQFADIQFKLFGIALKLVKKGGVIVYSTCTINPGENEELIAKIIRTYPEAELVAQEPYFGCPGLKTSSLYAMKPEYCQYVQRFDITKESPDTIGFFIAKFIKK